MYLSEELRIYQYLDSIDLNPVDLGCYLKETRVYESFNRSEIGSEKKREVANCSHSDENTNLKNLV